MLPLMLAVLLYLAGALFVSPAAAAVSPTLLLCLDQQMTRWSLPHCPLLGG
ncbi:hypothetical protein CGRA01v4_02796 [Colletotrichum graminicola]|nr:hypothetical protein CGRA01v4_02796 [Colletotrichum graminicola]